MEQNLVRISKFLSRVLHHKPERIGLKLDANGWVDVDALIACTPRAHVQLTRELLERTVAENDKQRFAFNDDHTKIRASQGHSIAVDLQLAPQSPPEFLYHGTAQSSLPNIRRQGLLPRGRNQVHLSRDLETATRVGARHGEPVVLTVKAGEMFKRNFLFYRSANGVWLTARVPPEFLAFPASEGLE